MINNFAVKSAAVAVIFFTTKHRKYAQTFPAARSRPRHPHDCGSPPRIPACSNKGNSAEGQDLARYPSDFDIWAKTAQQFQRFLRIWF
jgi:hypothetical protein